MSTNSTTFLHSDGLLNRIFMNIHYFDKTIRQTAADVKLSKSCVYNIIHKEIKYRMPSEYSILCEDLKRHFDNKHINGGKATHNKYMRIKQQK